MFVVNATQVMTQNADLFIEVMIGIKLALFTMTTMLF